MKSIFVILCCAISVAASAQTSMFGKPLQFTKQDSLISYDIIIGKEPCPTLEYFVGKSVMVTLASLYEIDGQDWHNCYGDHGCQIKGKLYYKGEIWGYTLNMSGFAFINKGDEQHIFGCKQPECIKYFFEGSFCNDNGEYNE